MVPAGPALVTRLAGLYSSPAIGVSLIDPTNRGFEFVAAERSGKRALVIRDGQHEYAFTER